jgi:uncharacterized membrane protein required for colicin V production
MILMIITLLIMLACGVSQYRNGLFTSFVMLITVFLSGLVAFGFWEPCADLLEPYLQGSGMAGTEDLLCLLTLFCATLLVLRVATNYVGPELIEQNGIVQFFGAGAVGLVTGYFLAGFLLCCVQTLPFDEQFMGFEPRSTSEPPYRSICPPDRVWLTMMRHAGAGPYSWKEEPVPGDTSLERYVVFDRNATFELRYHRYRRGQMPYFGEFDREIGRKR